jgi:hypothetical protein
MSEQMRKIVARAEGTGERVPAALHFPTPAELTHETAVAELRAQRFDWMKQDGETTVGPSDRCLTYYPGCCHGWIEISGEPGLKGPVVMRVDEGFPLRFPSLVDLVAHLGEEVP